MKHVIHFLRGIGGQALRRYTEAGRRGRRPRLPIGDRRLQCFWRRRPSPRTTILSSVLS